jgi:hypothetical protein
LALNGRRLGKALLQYFSENVLGHRSFLKGVYRLGNAATNNGDSLGFSPLLSRLFIAAGHGGVLDIEVLLKLRESCKVPLNLGI